MQTITPDQINALWVQINSLERQIASLKHTIEQNVPADALERLAYESHFHTETIYHLTPLDYYTSIPEHEPYLPDAYAADGFIHCTRSADLLAIVANRFYKQIPGQVIMLVIEVSALKSPLKYEISDGPVPFPHIYGALNRDAIVEIVKMLRAADGTFLVPPYIEPSV
jgi:uncharacterized protein (DUF952 family)